MSEPQENGKPKAALVAQVIVQLVEVEGQNQIGLAAHGVGDVYTLVGLLEAAKRQAFEEGTFTARPEPPRVQPAAPGDIAHVTQTRVRG